VIHAIAGRVFSRGGALRCRACPPRRRAALAFCSTELASSLTEVATSAPQLKKERAMSQEADDKGLAAVVLERLEN